MESLGSIDLMWVRTQHHVQLDLVEVEHLRTDPPITSASLIPAFL